MKKLPLFMILVALSAPSFLVQAREAAAPVETAARTKIYNAESFTLDNGMAFVVIPNHRVPAVSSMVWYKVGAADEPRGLSGMAHYLEHLLFKGTPTVKPGEFSKIVRGLGGNDNAFTTQDYTPDCQVADRLTAFGNPGPEHTNYAKAFMEEITVNDVCKTFPDLDIFLLRCGQLTG